MSSENLYPPKTPQTEIDRKKGIPKAVSAIEKAARGVAVRLFAELSNNSQEGVQIRKGDKDRDDGHYPLWIKAQLARVASVERETQNDQENLIVKRRIPEEWRERIHSLEFNYGTGERLSEEAVINKIVTRVMAHKNVNLEEESAVLSLMRPGDQHLLPKVMEMLAENLEAAQRLTQDRTNALMDSVDSESMPWMVAKDDASSPVYAE